MPVVVFPIKQTNEQTNKQTNRHTRTPIMHTKGFKNGFFLSELQTKMLTNRSAARLASHTIVIDERASVTGWSKKAVNLEACRGKCSFNMKRGKGSLCHRSIRA